ncbi:hypothetical protein NPIL_581351 [Nephila pilipes]|uniref:Uncharacterized protein n=1 Tax=Nephila pilipes TaxID=299642 RepID=A0A8X6QFH9_NEPPI|nr:hypothetical protein NPIL_581351 [Nephila pilipes]
MNKLVVFLILFCALPYQFGEAINECERDIKILWKAFHDVIESPEVPKCFKEYQLERFQDSGGVNEEEDWKIYNEYVKYLQSLDAEGKRNVVKCMQKIGDIAYEYIKDEILEKCDAAVQEFKEATLDGDFINE